MKDVAMTGGDLVLSGGDLVLRTGPDAIAQRLEIRLRTFRGEWFLDRNHGVPYYQEVLAKGADPVIVDAAFKDVILGTDGVRALLSYDRRLDAQTRHLSIRFEVATDAGNVSIETSVP